MLRLYKPLGRGKPCPYMPWAATRTGQPLIDFLNELLPDKHKIKQLIFKNPEQSGVIFAERKAIFDIHCENDKGDRFIVEMQKAKLKFFKDRSVFYTTFPIREQAEKGDWDFKLTPIYCVAILDFTFDEQREQKNYISNVNLKDQYCQTFYDKLTYIFIEMPRFTLGESELKTHFDKWLYFLKNLESFEDIPKILNEKIFMRGFEIAKLANFDRDQLAAYEESLMAYRDLKGAFDTSYEEGIQEGIEKGRKEGEKNKAVEIAKKMKKRGSDIDFIAETTGLSREEIDKLADKG